MNRMRLVNRAFSSTLLEFPSRPLTTLSPLHQLYPDCHHASNKPQQNPYHQGRRSSQNALRRRHRNPALSSRLRLRRCISRAPLFILLQAPAGTSHRSRMGLDMEPARLVSQTAQPTEPRHALRIEQEHRVGSACARRIEERVDRGRDQRGAIAGWSVCWIACL